MRHTLIMVTLAVVIVWIGSAGSGLAQTDLSLLDFVGGSNGGNAGNIPIAPGGQALYGLVVWNPGPVPATNIVVVVTFPPKTTINNAGPPPWSCSSAIVNGNRTLTCTLASLASADTVGLVIVIDLATDYPWQNGLSATATVTSTPADPNMSNNSKTVNLAVEPPTAIPALDTRSLTLLIAMLAVAGLTAISRKMT